MMEPTDRINKPLEKYLESLKVEKRKNEYVFPLRNTSNGVIFKGPIAVGVG